MPAFKAQNLAYEIAEHLRTSIIRMDLKPGERLVESKIAGQLNVSQSSVREALRILEKNGLVEINQRRGTYVTALSINSIDIMYDIVSDLYSLLIRKAMEKQKTMDEETDSFIKELLKVFTRLEDSAHNNDVEKYFNAIFEIAAVTLVAVESPLLTKIITELWHNKQRVEYMTLKHRKEELIENLKYFDSLKKYMLEFNEKKLVETIRKYTENEKRIAISILEKKDTTD